MSRARRYPVAGDPGPIPADKPVPTKEQLLMILDISKGGVMTGPGLLLAAARLFRPEPPGMDSARATSWARRVMDYPAAQRLLDQMEREELIIGREAWEWAEVGFRLPSHQARTTYFMSMRRARDVDERNSKQRDAELWEAAGLAADQAMRRYHTDRWASFRDAAYEALKKGAGSAHKDTQEP